MDKECLGIVCSRSGSKRLEGKNQLPINGRPLALKAFDVLSTCIKNVVHLTDIEEFLKEKDSISRPEHLNRDDTPLPDVVLWYLRKISGEKDYNTVILLMPTNPWITPHDVEKAISIYVHGKFRMLRSYSPLTYAENGLYIMDVDYMLSNAFVYDV